MDRFSHFMIALSEMARVAEEDKIRLDGKDLQYLKNFISAVKEKMGTQAEMEPDMIRRWLTQAIMYRYSPKVLGDPNAPTEMPPTTFETSDGKRNISLQLSGIPLHAQDLRARLEDQGYDVDRFDAGKQMAKTTAQKVLDYWMGKENQEPFISAKQFQKGYKTPAERGYGHQYSKERDTLLRKGSEPVVMPQEEKPQFSDKEDSKLLDKGILKFDDDDKKFFDYFRNATLKNIDHPTDVLPGDVFIRSALMRRYSPYLIEDPQAGQSHYGGEQGQYFDMKFPYHGKMYEAEKVPVNANKLKVKLKKLAELGKNFLTDPISHGTASRWLAREGIKKSGKDYAGKLWKGNLEGTKLDYLQKKMAGYLDTTFDMIKDKEAEQEKYLAGQVDEPATTKAPSVAKRFDYDVPWTEILEQESRIALKRAELMLRAKVDGPQLDRVVKNDAENIKDAILIHLMSDKAMKQPQYGDQEKRIRMGVAIALEEFRKQMNPTQNSEERHKLVKNDLGTMAQSKQHQEPADVKEPQVGDSEHELMKTAFNALRDKDDVKLLPNVSIEDLTDQFMAWMSKREKETGSVPNNFEKFAKVKDLLNSNSVQFAAHKAAKEKVATPGKKEPMKIAAQKPSPEIGIVKKPVVAKQPAPAPVQPAAEPNPFIPTGKPKVRGKKRKEVPGQRDLFGF